jgi:hypothetical protein
MSSLAAALFIMIGQFLEFVLLLLMIPLHRDRGFIFVFCLSLMTV